MSVELKLRAPYVGPSAFREGDVLYGRDAEALDLCDLLIASRIVLLSSPSGAGKTSLIQARIVPDMRKEGFRIHPLIRVGGAPQSLSGVDNQPANRYVNCTINCLEHDQPGATPDGNGRHLDVNLSRYLDLRSAEDDAESELFIFDQFEEILTADPTDQDAKREFFRQLGAVLRKPHRWALFAIREDYAASLEPYARRVPTGLRTTYHLECLGPTDARRAIQEPALRAGVTITDDAANRLVDDLRQVRVQHPDGSVTEERGPYIEPVQLQIACLRVWHLVNPEPGARIEVESLPPRTTVNEALADYYADQMCAVATHTRVPERKIRDWIQTYLITPQDIRGQVPLGPDLTQGLENAAVKGLENAYILREDRRGNAIWYELAHDRLVRPIQQNNAHWFATHLNVLQQQAALWDRSGRARGLLLGGTALDDQAAWADQHAAELSEVERRYLDESKHARDEEEREHRNARRILRLFVVVCVLLVGMIFASGLAWVLRQQAEQARADAVAAQITAEAAQVAADNARLTAEEQGRIAQSRAVTAAAMSQLLQDPETSVLLALEALKIQETSDAEAALRLSLAQSHVRSVVRGHTKSVLSVAFSPDGTRVLTASQDQTARVADAATGKSLSILSGHTGWIFKAMFDRGGGRVITAGVDGTARIWTADSGTPIAVLQGQSQPVTYAEFSPGGRRAVTASQSGTAWIWDVSSALPARRVEVQQDGWIRAARFSPDGQRLVTASRDGTARVWSTASGAQLAAFDEHTGGLLNAVFSPDGTRVLTTSEDKTARVWDASSGALQSVLAGHRENVNGGMFSPDGKQVLSWSDDGTARVWVADGGALVTEIRGQEDPITSASFSPDGHWVVTASMDGTARIWDARSGREFQQLRGHHDIVAAAEFSPDGSHVVTGSGDGTARIWEVSSPGSVRFYGHLNSVFAAAFSPDGTRIVTASQDRTSRVWDAASGAQLTLLQEADPKQQRPIIGAAFSPDSTRVVTASQDWTARVWDAMSGEQLAHFWHEGGTVTSARFSPDGRQLLTANEARSVRLWDLATGEWRELGEHPGVVLEAVFSPDGRRVATAEQDGTALLWDVTSGARLAVFSGHTGTVQSVAFSPDGTRLVTGSADSTARVWDVTLGTSELVLRGHIKWIGKVAFSPDGKTIVTTGGDGSTRIWDASDGTILGVLGGHAGWVGSAAFSVDGTRVLTAGEDGTAFIEPISVHRSLGDLVSFARTRVTREPTAEERRDILHETP